MPERPAHRLGVMFAGFFLFNFDAVLITPLFGPIAKGLHVDVGAVTVGLTAYLLLFGVMQPVHGNLSDAVGRITVMRYALFGMGVANVVAATAPSLTVFVLSRAASGACAAALGPLTIAYVGDRVAPEHRRRTIATLLSCSALGAAAATIIAALANELVSWRAALVVVAVAGPVLGVLYGRLPAETRPATATHRPLERVAVVFGSGWFRFLFGFAFVEGAAMLGFFNFFNAALQAHGKSILLAGLVTSSYGLAAVAGGYLVRLRQVQLSPAALFGLGGGLLSAGYLLSSYTQSVPTILAGSVLAGLALATAQSMIQTWAIEVAPPAVRGTATSLIACAVFVGAAVSTATTSGLVTSRSFGLLFGIAAGVAALVAVVGTLSRSRFRADGPGVTPVAATAG